MCLMENYMMEINDYKKVWCEECGKEIKSLKDACSYHSKKNGMIRYRHKECKDVNN
jgi:hypothetical protein